MEINVKKTIQDCFDDPYAIFCILTAEKEEAENKPLQIPPSDEGLDLLIWGLEGDKEFGKNEFLKKEEYNPELLTNFAKKSEEEQQRILLRASYLYLRFFQFKGRGHLKLIYK